MFILVKADFFLEGIQGSSLIIKNSNKQIKTSILIKLIKNSVIITVVYGLGTKLRNFCVNVCTDTTPFPSCLHTFTF